MGEGYKRCTTARHVIRHADKSVFVHLEIVMELV